MFYSFSGSSIQDEQVVFCFFFEPEGQKIKDLFLVDCKLVLCLLSRQIFYFLPIAHKGISDVYSYLLLRQIQIVSITLDNTGVSIPEQIHEEQMNFFSFYDLFLVFCACF